MEQRKHKNVITVNSWDGQMHVFPDNFREVEHLIEALQDHNSQMLKSELLSSKPH